jgi:hypothetical protein
MHPGDVCSAVKAFAAHLVGTVRVAPMEGLDVAGGQGALRVALALQTGVQLLGVAVAAKS